MEWNGMENGMEWKENFGMEYGRCSEWNGRFEKWNGRSSSILQHLPNSELVSRNGKWYYFADRTIDKNCMTNRRN